MGWTPQGILQDTFDFTDHPDQVEYGCPGYFRVDAEAFGEELACPAPRLGTYYPNVSLMVVPW